MLERLFENIITNAVKYSNRKDIATVRIEQHNQQAHIYVIDHGRGMAEKSVKRAFDRFYRESKSRSDEGTGLGLAISKAIAEQHYGTIGIESSPGRGTTVIIVLPLQKGV
ncbi:MAG: sensor histidine kinase, partial [Candidatus Saccharimonadales bacterium]